jgi:8-oxo-dGTP diphosphatase
MQKLQVVCGVAQRTQDSKEQVFLAKRGSGGPHAGLWEFPGGKVETGESDSQAIERELLEELGCEIDVLSTIGLTEDNRIQLTALVVRFHAPPACLEAEAIAWHDLDALCDLGMPPCDKAIVTLLLHQQNGV